MRILLCCLLCVALFACTSTSPTGRQQLILMSESVMIKQGSSSYLALQEDSQIISEGKESTYLNCVASPLIAVAKTYKPNYAWEIKLFADKQVNAFALPGGKMGVYSEMLLVAQTDDQLAAVIAHEIAHVLARHGNERYSRGILTVAGMNALNVYLGSTDNTSQENALVLGLSGALVTYGVTYPHSRSQESEADIMGLDIMMQAGYDPQAAITLWQNMQNYQRERQQDNPPEWLSTHPAKQTRITQIKNYLANTSHTPTSKAKKCLKN